ncbi:GntR family transcriptional regulator [Thermogemmatispora aurantia]|nr:GntR family transcriptional regulator [Thermogemmatispora aurantia]
MLKASSQRCSAHLLFQQLVEQGMLTPGERLPPGRELAAQLRLSRTALREALQTTTQRHCYTMRSLVLLEALSLSDLPEGFALLCELVMQRDLRDHQRVAALSVRPLGRGSRPGPSPMTSH